MQSVASEAVEFGVREAGRFLSSRDRPYRDSACSASLCLLACSSQRKDATHQSPAVTSYCLSPVSQLVVGAQVSNNQNSPLISQMTILIVAAPQSILSRCCSCTRCHFLHSALLPCCVQ